MRKRIFFMTMALLTISMCVVNCVKTEEQTARPEIIFANDIKVTMSESYNVFVLITSSVGLKEIIVDKIIGSKITNIEDITEFDNPQKYTFSRPFTVSERTLIRFTAIDVKGNQSIDSFEFNLNN